MKKFLLLPMIMAVCAIDFAASAAPRGRGASSAPAASNTTTGAAPVSARSAGGGIRGTVKPTAKATNNASATQNAAAPSTGVSARAAKKQAPVAAGKQTATTAGASSNSARAASTQKVINAGTKVSTAATNTAIPQECQDAFFGCMDAFCMLDNASGGRCQCNDRVTELDKVLEDILKLDEQSYIMATEGVERLQMGENADAIMARAKAASDAVAVKEQQKQQEETKAKKKKTLDLSAWNTNAFSSADDDEEDVFGATKAEDQMLEDFVNKRGDELYKASAKMCGKQIPEQCLSYSAMLQGVYQQKIRSDCTAYENSLKQQKSASQQKLRTAQQALREAALESFEEENKYEDLGSCVVAFKQCMQTTGECGSDFSGCVADNATLGALYKTNTTKNSVATIKLTESVTISKATYDIVNANALKCESVVKKCINANGGKDLTSGKVLPAFLRDIAPTLYSTEYRMASDSRMNCISTIVSCVKKSCKSAGFEEGSDNYDACLSNPDSIKNYCALEINKCGDVGSQDNVVSYVMAKLAADRVDKCTEEVKTCLQKEDHCGEGYTNCIGLDTDTIFDFCPSESLMACQSKHKADDKAVREYVARVAQGLALNIDRSFQETCEKAAKDAMVKVCGSEDDCAGFTFDNNVGSSTLKYQVCQIVTNPDTKNISVNLAACKNDVSQITKEEMGLDKLSAYRTRELGRRESGSHSWGFGVAIPFLAFGGGSSDSQTRWNYFSATNYQIKPGEVVMYSPMIIGQMAWGSTITLEEDGNGKLAFKNTLAQPDESDVMKKQEYESVVAIVTSLNNTLNNIMNTIEVDPTVDKCMNGTSFQGISAGGDKTAHTNKAMQKGKRDAKDEALATSNGRFKNLTRSLRQTAANQVYTQALSNYNEKLAEYEQKRAEDYLSLSSKYDAVMAENDETALDQRNGTSCNQLNSNNSSWNYKEKVTAVYSDSSNICTKTTRIQKCKKGKEKYAYNPGKRYCEEWEEATETTQQLQM